MPPSTAPAPLPASWRYRCDRCQRAVPDLRRCQRCRRDVCRLCGASGAGASGTRFLCADCRPRPAGEHPEQ